MVIQLDFFETTEESEMKYEIEQIRDSCNKVRKSLFGKHGELQKMYNELNERISIIEQGICKN